MGNIEQHIRDATLIIVPIYNEGAHIERVINHILHAGYSNIVCVDDGSRDNTPSLCANQPITYIRHCINRGQGAAIQTGFDYFLSTQYTYCVTFDGDGQFDPKNIDTVVMGLITASTDVCIGNRFMQKNTIPLLRRLYNFIAKIVTFILSGIIVHDSQSGFKAFTRNAVAHIDLHTSGYEFCTELIREIGQHQLPFNEVPVHVSYTKESMKKGQSFAGGVKTVFKLFIRSLMN